MKRITLLLLFVVSSVTLLAQANDDLLKACYSAPLATVKSLVEAGADVNYKNPQGQTPISVAYFSPEITEYLLSKGADPNGGDYPSLVTAPRYYSVEVMKLLLKAGADPNKDGIVKVDQAATVQKLLDDEKAKGKKANKAMVKAYQDMIDKMPKSNVMTFTALQNAVGYTNCTECVELLLNAGAKTDFKSTIGGGNLLHEVASSYAPLDQRAAAVAANGPALEKYGLLIPDWYKELNVYNFGGPGDLVRLLKSKGADMEALDNQKQTPLKAAIMRPIQNEEVIMAFIDNGANIKNTGMENSITEFAEDTKDPEKIKVKFDFPREGRNDNNGAGYSANMDKVNPKPKRVALISFYLYDAGKGKANITGTGVWRTPESAGQNHINGFYAKSIGKFKETFKSNGVELLTPEEFLDTQEKAETYYGFVQESAKKEKTSITRMKSRSTSSSFSAGGYTYTTTTTTTTTATIGTLKVTPAGMGFREFFVANEAEDESYPDTFQGGIFTANRKLTSNLGYDLCKALGVDAVVVVYIATRKLKMNQDDFAVNAVVSVMLGPNPVRTEATDPEAKNLGQFYCGTRTFFGSPKIFKESKGIFGQYDGMANILGAHAAKMCKYVMGTEKDD
jgi:ankyrin repeat protein